MGNKQSKTRIQSGKGGYNYTSIGGRIRAKKIFLSPDNNTCIIVDENNHINIYYFSQTQNEFIKNNTYYTKTNIDDVIYDPFHQILIYWNSNELKYHQFSYIIDIDQKIKIRYTDNEHTLLKSSIKDSKIINTSIFAQGNILLFVLDINNIIAMKWNESHNKCSFIKQYKISKCQKIVGVGFHEKRNKMVLLKLYNHHYYLNIYSIGQMLRCIDSIDDKIKIESMDKPNLLLSRLVYTNPHCDKHGTMISEFIKISKEIDNKYRNKEMQRLLNISKKYNGILYVISTHFGINEDHCKLIFSGHGDKILYQAGDCSDDRRGNSGKLLHKKHLGHLRGHAVGKVSGWMNDYGATHIIDVNTGNSLWSTGESSKDKGIIWTINDYLIVFKGSTQYRCSFNLEGFESETMIAECIFNDVITTYNELHGFIWDLCLLIAIFRGATDRWYREITLCKYDKNINISLEINRGSQTKPINVYHTNKSDKWIVITTQNVKKNTYNTHFYESKAIGMKAFGDDDILIQYGQNNGLICRNLTSPNDIFGQYFREAQNKWGKCNMLLRV